MLWLRGPSTWRLWGALPTASAAGQTVAVAQATETDLAQPITWAPKHRLVNTASETDSAQAISRLKTLAIAQAVETDSSQGITALKRIALGQASETDTAQTISAGGHVVSVGQTSETDLAQAITWAPKIRTVGLATETDQAQAVTAVGGQQVVEEEVVPGWTYPHRAGRVPSREEREAEILRQRQDFGVLPVEPPPVAPTPAPAHRPADVELEFRGEHPPELPVNVIALEARRKAQNEAMLLLLMAA